MKKIALIISFLLLGVATASAREIYNINKDWRFAREASVGNVFKTVSLPYTWNGNAENGKFSYGIGTFLKEIKIPKNWITDKRVFIRFGAVSDIANLFINGKYVGEHKGGNTAFVFEVTPFLMSDVYNSIMVTVSNAKTLDVIPLTSEINSYGGITRDVEMIVTDKQHISLSDYASDGVYLNTVKLSEYEAQVDATVKVEGLPGNSVKVNVAVLKDTTFVTSNDADVVVSSDGKGEVILPLTILNPRLWNGVEDPFMYNVRVALTSSTGTKDEVKVKLGLRSFSIDPTRGFFLNGRPYPLRGVNYAAERKGVGAAITRGNIEEDFDIITDMGANAVRMSFAPHSRYAFERADEDGLIVWSDLPFVSDEMFGGKGFINSEGFRDNGEMQLIEMIRQNYNSPSVALWGIFSDVTSKGDNPLNYIRQLNDLAHRESPDRLTVGSSIEDGPINYITDAIAWSQFFGWNSPDVNDIFRWLDQFKKDYKDLKPGISEYGAGGNITHTEKVSVKPNPLGDRHPESWQTQLHEQYLAAIDGSDRLWGSFASTMFDHASDARVGGDANGSSDFGLVTADRHNFKDSYYVYKSIWNKIDPFIHIEGKRNNQVSSSPRTIKAYTNLENAELYINGKSMGRKIPRGGIVQWTDIVLPTGENKISVESGKYKDFVILEVFNGLLAQ